MTESRLARVLLRLASGGVLFFLYLRCEVDHSDGCGYLSRACSLRAHEQGKDPDAQQAQAEASFHGGEYFTA